MKIARSPRRCSSEAVTQFRNPTGTWEMILDRLRAGCDEVGGRAWTVAADATVVRAHQHAAGARHAPPADVDRPG
jgi:hypothetical protein